MRRELVFGDGWISAEIPDDAVELSPGVSLPLPATPDLERAYRQAVEQPLDGPPLRELARGARRVTVAFDDPTVPCYAPAWGAGMSAILSALAAAGAPDDGVTLVCANALHRRFTHVELAGILGKAVVTRFAGRLVCHDAEDAAGNVELGRTPSGHIVEVSRLVTESDLTVYLNCSTTRGFSGGWKSICVGLSTYRSIRQHHDPDTMSMSLHRNRMHDILDEMGEVVDAALGPRRIFKLETVLSNPLQVHRVFGGTVAATRKAVLALLRANQPPRRSDTDDPVDVVLYGVPDWSPYAAYAFTNPILTLISTGLGYLGGMIEAAGKPGCTVVLATPAPNRWDDEHHPSYRDVWERVLPATSDPYEARRRFEPELAADETYIERYRRANAFHPTHAVMALYPLKRLRHAGRVVVVGAQDPAVPAHLGFDAAPTVEDALASARTDHGAGMRVGVIPYPPAINRK